MSGTPSRGATLIVMAAAVIAGAACDGREVQRGDLFEDDTGFSASLPDYFTVGATAVVSFSTAATRCDSHVATRVTQRDLEVTVEPFDRIADFCDLELVRIRHEFEVRFRTWGTARISIIGRDTTVMFERDVVLVVRTAPSS